MNADATLLEAGAQASSGGWDDPSGTLFYPPATLQMQHRDLPSNRAADTQFVFLPIIQSWPWLAQHTWVRIGPISKLFRYTVNLRMIDGLGNNYGEIVSPPLDVMVIVSREKQTAADAALISVVASALLAVASLALPWLALASGAASVAAESAGTIALDPPDPDSTFNEPVPLPAFSPSDKKGMERHAINTLLEAINWLLTSRQTLFIIEGKMMGAHEAKDSDALTRQTNDYQELVRRMWKVAGDLSHLTVEAVEEVADVSANQAVLPKLLAWSEYGIPNEDWDTLTSLGLPPAVLYNLEMALKEEQARKSFAAANITIARMASATLKLVREIVASTFGAAKLQS